MDFSDTSTPQVPDSYAVVRPVEGEGVLNESTSADNHFRPVYDREEEAKRKDEFWIAHVTTILQHDTFPQGEVITWSGYNSRLMSDGSVKPRAQIVILPLFKDKAASLSMMKHAMELTVHCT